LGTKDPLPAQIITALHFTLLPQSVMSVKSPYSPFNATAVLPSNNCGLNGIICSFNLYQLELVVGST
jgi:hypothetical protein